MPPHSRSRRFRFLVAVLVFLAGVFHASTSAAQAPTAQMTYPTDGATNADISQAIQWTTVLNVQAYYLYVGSIPGANDLVNTGEIQATSYVAATLPPGQTVFARLWTRAGGVWRFSDSSFTTSTPVVATLTSPVNGATNVNITLPMQWTTVINVQAYYLYVGTTLGAKDLVNTGEIQATSYLATIVPTGQAVFARLWTKAGGAWRYSDSTFVIAVPVAATLTYPIHGATNVDLSQAMQWTTVPYVQAYYLYVGTVVGAKDLVNTGEIQATSYQAVGIPGGQTVFVRLWTRTASRWWYRDSTFTAALPILTATLTYPADGAVAIDQSRPFTWTAIANVQAYYLYVGSTLGAKDLVNSGEVLSTTLPIVRLPSGPTLYARLYTRTGGVWRYRESTFTASPGDPAFVFPSDGAVAVDGTQPFRWTRPINADAQILRVGTSAGSNDLFDSGQIAGTSAIVNGLPQSGTLYARVLSRGNSVWRFTDIAFTLEASSPVASIVSPGDGQTLFDTANPFEWSVAPLARGYRLTIGTTPGASDLHDSGEISVTRRFVPNLPIGSMFGRIETKINGQWSSRDFGFSVGVNTVSAALQIASAMWATDVVRQMALIDNRAFSWTALAAQTSQLTVDCADYAEALLDVLAEMNVVLPARRLGIALNPNRYDTHTLVEMFDTASQRWLLLDPTFDLSVRRTTDGSWASAEDMSSATRAQRWADVSYVFLSELGDYYARGYYLDYPLLFVNVYHAGQDPVFGQGGPVLPYLSPVALPASGNQQLYIVGCPDTTSAELIVNGTVSTIDCSGVDRLSYSFYASSISATTTTPASVTLYRPVRFVF